MGQNDKSGSLQDRISQTLFENIELFQKHNSYMQEIHEMKSIETGNVDLLRKSWQEDIGGEYGRIADSPDRQARNLCIVTISNAARAAIRGGILPEVAFTICDIYLYQVEKLPLSELLEHVKSAEIQFTLAVKKVRDNNINSRLGINDILAAQCQHYIFEHLHERIDIKKMGDDLGYNSSYLSHHFKAVTGISLKQYILNEKIEAAKELLVYSQYKFSDIAFFLGFCSQSHLGKVFQQKTGMTLREFKQKWQSRE